MYVIKIVKNKNYGSFYILSIYFNLYFNVPFPTITFQQQNLVKNNIYIYDGYLHKLNTKLFKK